MNRAAAGRDPAESLVAVAAPRRRATGRPRPWLVAGCRWLGAGLVRLVFRLQVEGREHVPTSGAVLLASNHSGFLDGPLVFLLSPRPLVLLVKSELFAGPLARPLGWLGQVPVHRGRPDRRALTAVLATMTGGGAVGVFPEGTRGTGELAEVQDGLAFLALRAGAPVVPVVVLGTLHALPRGRVVPRWRAPVRVVFGPPVVVEVDGDHRARRTVRVAAEQLRVALVAHLHAAQQADSRRDGAA